MNLLYYAFLMYGMCILNAFGAWLSSKTNTKYSSTVQGFVVGLFGVASVFFGITGVIVLIRFLYLTM